MTVIEQRAYEAIIKMAHKDEPDYWTRLEHTYAGMAMQGIISNEDYLQSFLEDARGDLFEDIARVAADIAHALVEKINELVEEVNRLKKKLGEE